MADLLECLVQIRALKETPRRIAELLAGVTEEAWRRRPAAGVWAPVEVLAHLADVELLNGVRVRLMLTGAEPGLPLFDQEALAARARYLEWQPQFAFARFTARRAETLELLDGCSAAELERTGVHPRRGRMTVADLVALMLAHDTAHVGQLRERLGAAPTEANLPPEGEQRWQM
ncbi:MAG: DinB family protein [Acidobacteriota bacterium]